MRVRPVQRWTTFTQAGLANGSLRKIHAAVNSCAQASSATAVASHAFMWIVLVKSSSI